MLMSGGLYLIIAKRYQREDVGERERQRKNFLNCYIFVAWFLHRFLRGKTKQMKALQSGLETGTKT